MLIKIINDQKALKIDKKLIERIVLRVLKYERIKTDEIIFHFVDKKTIKKLHKKFFNDSNVTDCISLPIDQVSDKKTNYHILGEAFICTDVAIDNARTYKTSKYCELCLYVIHSLLHLIGYDDISKSDIEIMRKKEKFYLTLLEEDIK